MLHGRTSTSQSNGAKMPAQDRGLERLDGKLKEMEGHLRVLWSAESRDARYSSLPGAQPDRGPGVGGQQVSFLDRVRRLFIGR
jgi:hypothetical protein